MSNINGIEILTDDDMKIITPITGGWEGDSIEALKAAPKNHVVMRVWGRNGEFLIGKQSSFSRDRGQPFADWFYRSVSGKKILLWKEGDVRGKLIIHRIR